MRWALRQCLQRTLTADHVAELLLHLACVLLHGGAVLDALGQHRLVCYGAIC